MQPTCFLLNGLPDAVARRHAALEEDGPAQLREEVGRGDPAADDGLAPHPHQRRLGDVVVDDVPGREFEYYLFFIFSNLLVIYRATMVV